MSPSHTRLQNSTSSSQNHRSHTSTFSTWSRNARSSDSTQHTSSSTLWSPASTTLSSASAFHGAKSNGAVTASNNVINRVAEKNTSLFQYCLVLRNRCRSIPGFEEEVLYLESEEQDENPDDPPDPVSLMWRTFRRGYPCVMILNMLPPDSENPLPVIDPEEERAEHAKDTNADKLTYRKRTKHYVAKFLVACKRDLMFSDDEIPSIVDIYNDDTTGFVKFARLVTRVLDVLDERGLINTLDKTDLSGNAAAQEGGKRTKRQHITTELVSTERTYVQHLETLNDFKRYVEQRSIIPGDAIHDIFMNLGALLDFQRRFLVRIEQINSQPEDQQDWGGLFIQFGKGLRVYQFYIANQKNCEEAALRSFDKLKVAGGPQELQEIVESQTHFTAFLLKPFQRLSKYPLLLRELGKTGDFTGERASNLEKAQDLVVNILNSINDFVKEDDLKRATDELKERVRDWKGHQVASFGQLLLYGAYPVQKATTQQDREFKIYLFERIIVCCKEVNQTKKGKLMPGRQPSSVGPPSKPELHMKGRVFMMNLGEVQALSKAETNSWVLRLGWLSDDDTNNMVIKFPTQQELLTWHEVVERQKVICKRKQAERQEMERRRAERERAGFEFNYMHNQGSVENPFTDDASPIHPNRLSSREDLSGRISQHASNNSLRSRSTTNGSVVSVRQPAMAHTGAPLTLRTQELQANGVSPADRAGNSYFSPTAESPISSRTSSSSGMMPFPRQSTPSNGWTGSEEHVRYTAPAPVTRPLHNSTQSGYNPNDQRGMRAPGQAMPMHPAALSQNRIRSASSPDVQSQQQALSRQATANAPPVPSIPASLAGQQPPINRSQSNTPVLSSAAQARYPPVNANGKSRQGSHQHHDSKITDGSWARSPGSRTSAHTDVSFGPLSPTMSVSTATGMANFKLKVNVPTEGSTFALVVASDVSFDTLRERIDAKLQRTTNLTFKTGKFKLQFVDEEDGSYITMQNDDDVQTAFDQWNETHARDSTMSGHFGEIELYCNR